MTEPTEGAIGGMVQLDQIAGFKWMLAAIAGGDAPLDQRQHGGAVALVGRMSAAVPPGATHEGILLDT